MVSVVVVVLYIRGLRWKRVIPMLLMSLSPGIFIALTMVFQ